MQLVAAADQVEAAVTEGLAEARQKQQVSSSLHLDAWCHKACRPSGLTVATADFMVIKALSHVSWAALNMNARGSNVRESEDGPMPYAVRH
jgi:hypothetical protein